jgi:hypothetical protein
MFGDPVFLTGTSTPLRIQLTTRGRNGGRVAITDWLDPTRDANNFGVFVAHLDIDQTPQLSQVPSGVHDLNVIVPDNYPLRADVRPSPIFLSVSRQGETPLPSVPVLPGGGWRASTMRILIARSWGWLM